MKTANIGLSKITVQVKLPPNTFWWDCHLARGAYSGQEGKKNRLGAPSPVLPQYPCRLHYTIIKLHCHAVQQFIPNILQTCSTVPDPAPMTLHYACPKATEREPRALTGRCYLVQELCAGGHHRRGTWVHLHSAVVVFLILFSVCKFFVSNTELDTWWGYNACQENSHECYLKLQLLYI